MTDQNPAQTLTAAAEKLRQAAADAEQASPSPWRLDTVGPAVGAGLVYAADDAVIVVDRSMDDSDDDHGDLPYLALMHPGVGAALADWLESAACDAEQIGPDPCALAVARQLLGSPS